MKHWIYILFKKNKIEKIALYGSITRLMEVEGERITDKGWNITKRQLHDRLSKSIVPGVENRFFESDNYKIMERPILSTKREVKK